MIRVFIEPDNQEREFDPLNTVLQLLGRLHLRPTHALVIRGDELLTPDRRLADGDRIVVRKVVSQG